VTEADAPKMLEEALDEHEEAIKCMLNAYQDGDEEQRQWADERVRRVRLAILAMFDNMASGDHERR